MSTKPSVPTGLPKPSAGQPCPCGTGRTYELCCGPRLSGEQPAQTAEQLMRSRFTAHVAHDWRYLHVTYRPTSRKPYVDDGDAAEIPWTRLVVHAHEPGASPDAAFVDFSAYYATEHDEQALHEKAEFARVDGRWLYTRNVRNGPAPAKTAPKAGRNDPCPCGSGRKFKVCCGR